MSGAANVEGRLLLESHGIHCLLQWLQNIRTNTEDYEPPNVYCDDEPEEKPQVKSLRPKVEDKAFDNILGQIGLEIYKLEEYQRKIGRVDNQIVAPLAQTIVNMFDSINIDIDINGYIEHKDDGLNTSLDGGDGSNSSIYEDATQIIVFENSDDITSLTTQPESTIADQNFNAVVLNNTLNTSVSSIEYTNIDETNSIQSSSSKCNVNLIFDSGLGTPIAPKRKNRNNSRSSGSSIYDNIDRQIDKPKPISSTENFTAELESSDEEDTDSESTKWSYHPFGGSANLTDNLYQSVWTCSGGFHRSDKIMKCVLGHDKPIDNWTSYDSINVSENDRTCKLSIDSSTTVDVKDMTSVEYKLLSDNDEGLYEEVSWNCDRYSEPSISSVELFNVGSTWSVETPEYVNLNDPSVYTVPADVIAWKDSLLDPFYNDDEEDEWITPEESLAYSNDQRPPFIIPRITHYTKPYRPDSLVRKQSHDDVFEDANSPEHHQTVKDSVRMFDARRMDWSNMFTESQQRNKANSESPSFERIGKRLSGSNDNLLLDRQQTIYATSSSGDSLDVEYRNDNKVVKERSRKSRSVNINQKPKPPVPAPRQNITKIDENEIAPMQGVIKRTKYREDGKKVRKNWSDCYLVINKGCLIFYKDMKTYLAAHNGKHGNPPSPSVSRADIILSLRNAKVSRCTQQYTSRYEKSLVVSWPNGHQLLLADESPAGARYWYQQINQAIEHASTEATFSTCNNNVELMRIQQQTTTPVVHKHHDTRIKNGKAGDSSNEDLSDPSEVSNVRAKLKKFFTRRPTMDAIVQKGIYKDEPVFGRQLDEVCPTSGPRVPNFVVQCVRQIESSSENMKTDGLYRASGNLSQVQKIRLQINQNNLSIMDDNADVHVLTGSLKLFFRELKEPLVPYTYFHRILAASSITSREARTREFRDIVNSLPQCNRDTLKYLLQHLLRVTEYEKSNRMSTANLAIVFGPTLMWAPLESAHNIAIDCIQQKNVIEILLTDYQQIFEEKRT